MHTLLRIAGACFWLCRALENLCLRHYWIARFKRAGSHISISRDFRAHNPQCMELGSDVSISHQVTLRAVTRYPWSLQTQTFTPRLTLGDGCFIGNGSHISCSQRVDIGKNVMIAEQCYISDSNHDYRNVDLSIKEQPVIVSGDLTVGDDTWIGAHCCVSGAFTIGRHCVIGANSVVTSDIPDFSVAVGAPARVIKRYDPSSHQWINVPR